MAVAERSSSRTDDVIEVRRLKGKKEGEPGAESESEARLKRLFDELGGVGKIKVYRVVAGRSNRVWCGSFDPTPDFCENVEQRIAEAFGAGEFQLQAHKAEKNIASATVIVDAAASVLKKPEPAPTQPVASGEPSKFELFLLEQAREARASREAAERRSEQFMALMFKSQSDLLAAVLAGQAPRQAQAVATLAPTDPLDNLKKTVGVMKELREISGEGGGPSEAQSMGERVLVPFVTKIGEKVGDVVAEGTKKLMSPTESKPAAAGATSSPAAAGNGATQQQQDPRLPAGARPLTPDELARLRQTTQLPKPPAPKAAEVLPDANQEKK